MAASNDCGDVSWKVPMARLWFPGNVPNISYHHWTAGAALATSIAHKGAVAGAKALSASALDCLLDPSLVEQAKTSFRAEIGDVVYEPLLPADQKPRPDINRSAEHTSELQSLMRISYAVFCLHNTIDKKQPNLHSL